MVHLNKEYLKGTVERLERACGSERGDRYRERTRVSRRQRWAVWKEVDVETQHLSVTQMCAQT